MANGGIETYTTNAYYNDNTSLTEGNTFILSLDGDVDLTVGGGNTQMSGGNSTVSNSTGSTVDVTATQLAYTTQPAGSVSGSALTTPPVVAAQDAAGNTDTGFAETVTLTESSSGNLSNATATAASGVATFANLTYTASADQESFTLTANDQDGVGSDLPTTNASAVTSDVVATVLVYTTQPSPLSLQSGVQLDFSTDPVVEARDANSTRDTDFTDTVTLTETGAGTATYTSNSVSAVAGVATFTGLTITYTATANGETFGLQADDTAGGAEGDISTLPTSSSITATTIDSDGALAAGSGVSEPVALPSTANSTGAAVDLFDFALSDAGSTDLKTLDVTQVVLNTSGTGPFSQMTFRLSGPDASNVVGTYSSGANTLTFSGLSISVANGQSETYAVNAYYNDNTGLSENQTLVFSIDGDTDLTVSGSGTQMSGANAALGNSTGTLVSITATQLVLATTSADTRQVDTDDEVLSGAAFQTQPVVQAQDAAGNLDADFADAVVASLGSGSGQLSGTTSVTATGGSATFADLRYDAATDGGSFALTFDDQTSGAEGDQGAITSATLSADVVASQWVFTQQPVNVLSGLTLGSQPQVQARDAQGITDLDFAQSATLSLSLSGTLENPSATATGGGASFTGLKITGVGQGRTLTASGGGLTSGTSTGTWSVGLMGEGPVERTEIDGERVSFISRADIYGSQEVEITRTNSWGLSTSQQLMLVWTARETTAPLPTTESPAAGETTADSTPTQADPQQTQDSSPPAVAPIVDPAATDPLVLDAQATDLDLPTTDPALPTTDAPPSNSSSATTANPNDTAPDQPNTPASASETIPDSSAETTTSPTTPAASPDANADSVPTVDSSLQGVDGLPTTTAPDDLAPGTNGSTPTTTSPTDTSPTPTDTEAPSSVQTPTPSTPTATFFDVHGQPVYGLFDDDLQVEFDDFFLFSEHFGKAADQDGFDPCFDLNGDGVVGLADFFIFADHFGREAVLGN